MIRFWQRILQRVRNEHKRQLRPLLLHEYPFNTGEALKVHLERYALLLQAATDGLWDWDLRTDRVYFSPAWKNALGYEEHEIGDSPEEWSSRVHPDDLPAALAAIEEHRSGREPFYRAEFRMRHKDGHYRWIHAVGVMARDAEGQPYRFAGWHADFTLRKLSQVAYEESEERYRSLFEATFEAIILHHGGRIVDVNQSFERMSGYNRAEAVGMPVLDLVAPAYRDYAAERLAQALDGTYEVVAQRRDGSTLPVEVNAKYIDYQGRRVRVAAIRDITERRRVEQAERARREGAEALRDVAASINRSLRVDQVLDSVLENAGRIVPHSAANIMMLEGSEAVVVRARGYEAFTDYPPDVIHVRLPIAGTYNLETVVRTRAPLIMNDTYGEPRWAKVQGTQWIRSFLSAPIFIHDEIVALLNLDSDTVGAFTEQHAESLVLFAATASFALRNARLHEAVEQAYLRTEALFSANRALSSTLSLDELLSIILEQARRVVPCTSGSIGILENGSIKLRAIAGYDQKQQDTLMDTQSELEDSPILHQLRDTLQPVVIPDVDRHSGWRRRSITAHIRSWMGVPLMLGRQEQRTMIGVLSLDSDQIAAFSAQHVEMAQALASQAAIAIDKARLFEAERTAHQRAQALVKANRALSSTLSLRDVLQHILEQCAEVLSYRTGSILSYNKGAISMVAVAGYAESTAALVIERSSTDLRSSEIIHQMSQDLQPVIISDVREHPHWINLPDGDHIRAWLGAPLVVHDELIGILMLDSDQVNAYTADHLEMAWAFAEQAALAMHNAQLYEAEQREHALAQTLRQTSEALARSLQLDATLDLIMNLLTRVVRYDTALIVVFEGERLLTLAARGLSAEELEKVQSLTPDKERELRASPIFRKLIQGTPVLLQDAAQDPDWVSAEGAVPPRGWLGIPLIVKGATIGLLTIGSSTPGTYNEPDLEAVSTFAHQAAIAIENARLLLELETRLQELRHAQEQLTRSARLSAAGEMATGVAHQINNPLTVIMAESHLLLRHIAPGSFEHESAKAIREAAVQAGTVVRRMLDFAKVHPTELGDVDVNESVRRAVGLTRAQWEPSITLVLELDDSLPLVCGSAEHLEEVWLNLLLNAKDAIVSRGVAPGVGRIVVTTRRSPDGHLVEVAIADNGCGIPAEHLPLIFNPFFTTKDHGTGLGLSISQEFIEKQGGSIQVESQVDVGTTFVLRLPLAGTIPGESD